MSLGISACSSGIFFGSPEDAGVAEQRDYRRVNLACSGLNLASSQLSVTDFRKVLHCFNSNGALEPIENLINRLPDADLLPLVDVSNRYLLNNRSLLYQLEQTFYTLSNLKVIDSTFLQFGRLLQNDEFVSSSIALLKEGYAAGRVSGGISGDRNILLALQQLSTKITYSGASSALDAGLTLARSRAFGSMQGHFRGPSPMGRPLRQLTDQTLSFLQQNGDPRHVEAGRRLIEELANGNLFSALDELTGSEAQGYSESIPRLASVFNVTLGDDARILDGITSLFHYVHRPIPCLKGGKVVPDGVGHMVHALTRRDTADAASYLKRTGPLFTMALAPFCELPPELAVYYPSLISLADTTAIQPTVDLLKVFYSVTTPLIPSVRPGGAPVRDGGSGGEEFWSHPLMDLLVGVLADTGSREAEELGGPPENTAGIKLLLPALAELTDRGIWNDALLLAILPRDQDRVGLQEALRFLTQEMPGTEASIYSALTDAIARATPTNLYNFVHSLSRFVESDQPLLDPALTALRRAYHVNDAHPLIDLARNILDEAPSNDALFSTLFLISEMPEFKDSVRLVSEMSKDGRLKELMGAMLTIFHRFSVLGSAPVRLTQEPPFTMLARHDLADADMAFFRIGEESAVSNDSCRMLDTRVSLGDYAGAQFDEQLNHFVICSNADRRHDDFSDVVQFLRDNRDERGKHYVATVFDLVWALEMTRGELKYLADAFVASFDDHRFQDLMNAFKMYCLTEVRLAGDSLWGGGPAIKPLIDLFPSLMKTDTRSALHGVESFAGKLLRHPDLPAALRFSDDLLDQTPEPEDRARGRYDLDRIKRWVGNKECEGANPNGNPTAGELEQFKAKRAAQIMDDSDNAITNWDLTINGRPRRTWGFGELREYLDPLLSKFGDPEHGIRPGATVDALLNSLRYFTLEPGKPANEFQHYPRSELRRFLMDRAEDYRLITYFYPGESNPRVRLVTTMDRLELILINSDFWSPWPFKAGHVLPRFRNKRNFGLLFLGEIADAWGDEDEGIWPQEIKEKYRGSRPPTLAEAVASMKATSRKFERLVGFPRLNDCSQVADPRDPADVQFEETHDPYAHGVAPSWLPAVHIPLMRKYLFNIRQVFPVLEENLPVPGRPLGQGHKMANGMRILRDLFFQLAYSTPEGYYGADFRFQESGWRNNLSVIMLLERAGFTRQVTRNLRGMDANDPAVVDFFDGILDGATGSDDNLATTRHPRYRAHAVIDPLVANKPDYEDQDKPGHDLLWKVIEETFGVIDAAEGRTLDAAHRKQIEGKSESEVAQIRAEWVREYLHMKQMGYYAFAAAGQLDLIAPVLRTLGPVLTQFGGFLARNADHVQDLFRSRKTSYFMRALHGSQDSHGKGAFASILAAALNSPQGALDGMRLVQILTGDPKAKKALTEFYDRREALLGLSEYQALQTQRVMRPMIEFIEQRGTNPLSHAAARRLLNYLAERLEMQDLDQLLLLSAKDPYSFYRVMETLGHHIDDGDLPDFFREARDALADPARTLAR